MPVPSGSAEQGNAFPSNPILGTNSASAGVTGQSNAGPGVLGQSFGLAPTALPNGVRTIGAPATDGVLGIGKNGVHGQSAGATDSGVLGENTASGLGVTGTSVSGDGVFGRGARNGVHGQSASATNSGVWGENTGAGAGVTGTSTSGNAGEFKGNVLVTGTLNTNGNVLVTGTLSATDIVLTGADCAEQFDAVEADQLEPGTVVVIDKDGRLRASCEAYDKKVAGVVSGAGEYKTAIILDGRVSDRDRIAVAMFGKVYCWVDATYSPIEVGDLLTTSATIGYAMKVTDQSRAFGAVIGKALAPQSEGRGSIPILVASH